VKNLGTHVKRWAALSKRIRHEPLPPAPTRDPVTQLVIGFLQWEASRKAAEAAYGRLMATLVDNNELRVSHPHEIVALIGARYPRAEERAGRLHDVLQEVFNREHAVTLSPLLNKSRKDARAYLGSLPGMTQYVAALVMLLCFGGHEVPVDDTLAGLLKEEGVAEPNTTPEQIAQFLERQLKADEALATHLALQAWADGKATRKPARPAPAAAKKPARRPAGKKARK
jgi:endonuclease III